MTQYQTFQCPLCLYTFEIEGFPCKCPNCDEVWSQKDWKYFTGTSDNVPNEADCGDKIEQDHQDEIHFARYGW